MASKVTKLEFVNDETRLTLINQRLAGIEQEVVNAEIDFALEEAVASSYTDANRPGPGYPGSTQNVDQRRVALDGATARLEALRSIRGSSEPKAKD